MKKVHAIYEGGVFRPTAPPDLPEACEVEFEPKVVGGNGAPGPRGEDQPAELDRVYQSLSQRFDTGDPHLAQRHDEHQP